MLKDLLDSNGFIAIATSLFGGAGLAIVSKFLNRGESKSNKESQFREEQRQEIESLREQANKARDEEARIEAEVDKWKEKYYDLLVEGQKVQGELNIEIERLKRESEHLKATRDNLLGPK